MRYLRDLITSSMPLFSLTLITALSTSFSLSVAHAKPRENSRRNLNSEIARQTSESMRRLESNLDQPDIKPGAVIASPSKSHPNYYFHWVRDAALVMETFVLLRPDNADHADYRLDRWFKFERELQVLATQTGVGEPKYNVDGTPFVGEWGRPQNDGPGLRARTMALWVMAMHQQKKPYSNTVIDAIRADLDYTIQHWKEPSFDLWEEVKGDHFFTRMAQVKSLEAGAQLFAQIGDPGAAEYYRKQSAEMAQTLNEFWNADQKLVMPTIRQVDGWTHKKTNIDVAILLGSLYFTSGFEPFALTDDRVLSSLKKLKESFRFYEINAKSPVVSLGRYPEDIYDGTGFSHGNPWFLANAGYAQAQCRLSRNWQQQGHITVTELNQAFLNDYVTAPMRLNPGETIRQGDSRFTAILEGLKKTAKLYFETTVYHAGRDGRMDEQFSRYNGYMMGARDLSWSHASFLKATNECRPLLQLK